MIKILLIRHGETSWNENNIIQGHNNIGLSDKGRSQVHAVGNYIGQLQLNNSILIYSDLDRSADSAKILNEYLRIEDTSEFALREVDFGSYSGKSVNQLCKTKSDKNAWDDLSPHYKWDGGETFGSAGKRAYDYLNNFLLSTKYENIIVVSHGLIIQFLISYCLTRNIKYANRFTIENASISILNRSMNNFYTLELLNFLPFKKL